MSYGEKNCWPSASKRSSQTGSEGPLPNGVFWALGCPLAEIFPQQRHILTFCLSNPMLSPPFVASASCGPYPPPPLYFPGHRPGAPCTAGCGRGPCPRSETPPCLLRAREGKRTGHLWGVAHRTMPWAHGNTTTDPQDTPGYILPGAPQHILSAVHWPSTLGQLSVVTTFHYKLQFCLVRVRTATCVPHSASHNSQLTNSMPATTVCPPSCYVQYVWRQVFPRSLFGSYQRCTSTLGGFHACHAGTLPRLGLIGLQRGVPLPHDKLPLQSWSSSLVCAMMPIVGLFTPVFASCLIPRFRPPSRVPPMASRSARSRVGSATRPETPDVQQNIVKLVHARCTG